MSLSAEVVARFADVVGPDNVTDRSEELRAAETPTFAWDKKLALVVRPHSADEVRRCLIEASRAKIPIYPVSRGRNWGLGSRAPLGDRWILLDLRRMNRILDFDAEMATVTVEPGVTFLQLFAYLEQNAPELMAPVPGTVSDASVVGHALDRGDVLGVNPDRCAQVCALEIMLADGRCLRTGFDAFQTGRLGRLDRYGVGPALVELGFQSNLGVVTRLTLWLAPKPKHAAFLNLQISDAEALGKVADAVREVRLDGTLKHGVIIQNDYRTMTAQAARAQGDIATVLETIPKLRALPNSRWPRWYGSIALFAASEALRSAGADHVKEVLERHGLPAESISVSHDPPVDIYLGRPSDAIPRYLAAICGQPEPAKDDYEVMGCGMLWCPVALPLRRVDVTAAVTIADEVTVSYGFTPSNALLVIRDRIGYTTPALFYDRTAPGQDERAMQCHDELLRRLQAEGYLPFRVGIQAEDKLHALHPDTLSVMKTLKRALDPDDVIAPGRYDFRRQWRD